jgi:alpha-beta hydrolase superfamily lysophospholipase
MGGNIVLNHVVLRNYPIDALIVTSPWLKLYHEPPSLKLYMVSLLNRVYPSLTARLPFSAEDISHDPDKVREYRSDPLNHNKISLRLFTEMYNGGYNSLRNVYKINSPFLIMHGTADTITSHKASEKFVLNTSKRTRLKLWEGQFHELHNEFNKLEVFDYIVHWLKEYKL